MVTTPCGIGARYSYRDCLPMGEFATRGGNYLHVVTADSISSVNRNYQTVETKGMLHKEGVCSTDSLCTMR